MAENRGRCEGRRFTDEERMLVFRRILEGRSYKEIAAEFDSSLRFVYRLFGSQRDLRVHHGRSPLHLTAAEREEISRSLRAGLGIRAIARLLGRSPSTISREINRNLGKRAYRAWQAEAQARQSMRRSRLPKLASNDHLRSEVEQGLSKRWSPQQISAYLARAYPADEDMRVSHETIYQAL